MFGEKTVKLIRAKGWNALDDLGIKRNKHPWLELYILNYDQIDSPKLHPVVRECRALILDCNLNVVSHAFDRFYNIGEALEATSKFDWSNYRVFEKVDGSMIQLFFYQGLWRMATRSTFGKGKINEQKTRMTWDDLFWELFPRNSFHLLDKDCTYVFEMCSLLNQVVTLHEKPKLYLLDITSRAWEFRGGFIDTHHRYVDMIAGSLGIKRPKTYNIMSTNSTEVKEFVASMTNQEEGVVCQDHTGMRIKCKNPAWFALSKLSNNNNFYYKDLYDLVAAGDTDEVSSYYPEAKAKCLQLEALIHEVKESLMDRWAEICQIYDQKAFAFEVFSKPIDLGWVLFECKKHTITISDVFHMSTYREKIKKSILKLAKEKLIDLEYTPDSEPQLVVSGEPADEERT